MVSTSTGGTYLNKKESVVFKELCMISSLLVKDFGDGQIKGSLMPSNPCDPTAPGDSSMCQTSQFSCEQGLQFKAPRKK